MVERSISYKIYSPYWYRTQVSIFHIYFCVDHHGTEKEDSCLQNNKASPPLSARLREISNNLKLFCSATPLRVKLSEEVDKQHNKTMTFNDSSIEPRTPTAETCATRFNQKEVEIAKYCSPWEKFSQRSSGMKVVFEPFCLLHFMFIVYITFCLFFFHPFSCRILLLMIVWSS